MRIDSAIITGSFSVNGDTFNDLGSYSTTGSNTFVGNQSIVGAVSASALTGSINYTNITNVPTLVSGSEQIIGILSPLNSFTASNSTTNTFTSSATARLNSIETITASNISRLTNLESITGSLATTGSNTFIGTQTITGSLFISSNLIVQGTSSLQNITASAVSIGTNLINLNTANPAIRYAGLVIGDSGSVGGSGSFLYDSVQDEMIFVHRGTSTVVTSSVTLMGPQTFDNIGSETYPTSNIIQKGTGNEHLIDSCIFDNGTTTCVKNNLIGTGTACFGSTICSTNISVSSGELYPRIRVQSTNIGSSAAGFELADTSGTQWAIAYDKAGSGLQFFKEGAGNKMYLTNSGNLGIGTTCIMDTLTVGCNGGLVLQRFTGTDPYSGDLYFYSARGTVSSPTSKANGDVAMGIRTRGYNGSQWLDVTAIESKIEGTPTTNIICGNLIFSTNGGSTTLTERMRITATGNILIGTNTLGTATSVSDLLTIGKSGSSSIGVNFTDGTTTRWGFIYGNSTKMVFGSFCDTTFETGASSIERIRICSNGVVELKQYIKIGTGINSVCNLGISENQLWRTCGILYINSSGTGDVSIANGGGKVGIGIPDPSYPLQVKDAGIASTNTYFGTGQVRIGGGSDAGSNTVLSVAPGVITFDRPGVGGGALTINSNGHLTLPSQPSFFAVSTAGQTEFSSGAVMVFNTTRHNTGSHYNTSNGRFTAPVAGKYLFSVNFYTYPNIRASITVAINGSQYVPGDVVPLLYHENDVGSISSGFTILLSLSANDYVEVRSRAGYVSTVYMSHSHFLGQLLS